MKNLTIRGLASVGLAVILGLAIAPTSSLAAETDERPTTAPTPAIEWTTLANTTDTGFHFTMATKDSTSATGFRNKDNSTYVYVNLTKVEGAARMFVDGASDDKGTNLRDCTNGIYRARATGAYGLPNSVRGYGLNHARITSWGETGPAVVSGVWSPDSTINRPPMGS